MKERLSILELDNKKQLIDKLQLSGYAFAAWRKPGDPSYQLIISLKEVEQVEKPLSEMNKGFIVNLFADNHPVRPFHIAADIILSNEDITIDPTINSAQLDQFIQKLDGIGNEEVSDQVNLQNPERNDYESMVECAVLEIKRGTFEKVVLSRYKDVELPDFFSVWDFFQKINSAYPEAFCSLTFIPDRGLWMGASPELLLHNSAHSFNTMSLAGTKRLLEGQNLSEISWTQKEIEEQALVSRYIVNCFKKIRLREFHEHGPKTVRAGNLVHLKTEFEVRYDELPFEGLADQMVELLHPTSAVCGMPIASAKSWIESVESYDREFYSGFLGPVNFNHSTDLFVNLRCIKINEGKIRFYAGAGITEDSIPQREFEETEMKMKVLNKLI